MANREPGRVPDSDNRETPSALYAEKHERFNFNLDVAADHQNHKCDRYYTTEGLFLDDGTGPSRLQSGNGLTAGTWRNMRVWCNPPYSNIEPWVIKAWEADAELVYLLVPNWTDRRWWQDLVEPFRDGKALPSETGGVTLRTEFMTRQRFLYLGQPIRTKDGKIGQPEFGLVGLIFERSKNDR